MLNRGNSAERDHYQEAEMSDTQGLLKPAIADPNRPHNYPDLFLTFN
ncbi:hypothetical protein OsccyDRAFT_4142 [Leptolyngbyaceae cyanobacterium JSC-12]|nr:hypothetical protein OsccyDRAFT_4142 [Leptolyngbyaceae cyanobacterium JSC-12]